MPKKNKRKTKSRSVKCLEFVIVYLLISITRFLPLKIVRIISNLLGDLFFYFSSKRRNIAIENLRHAFKDEKSDQEIKDIARKSCKSLVLTYLENMKYRHLFTEKDETNSFHQKTGDMTELFMKAKKIHDESGGCITVTPHIGNWEIIPHVFSFIGMPMAIIARPLDNEYLEKLIYADRTSSGQILIPKRNALFTLRKALKNGLSIGMLPDQSTMKGILINFFGRPATTTPVPAILATSCKKPIVIVACCRKQDSTQYEGFVSDPIFPGEHQDKKAEIVRITEEMTHQMELIIRKHPEQYLWTHNRWKTYKGKKSAFS
jgi:KDO2-lipid IV(A) lauroyltransferase